MNDLLRFDEDAKINKARYLIFFGAGKFAQHLYQYYSLLFFGTKPDYFAVTSMDGNPETIEGIPVRAICDLVSIKDDATIILAVGMGQKDSAIKTLTETGFTDFIMLSYLVNLCCYMQPFLQDNAPSLLFLPNEHEEWLYLVQKDEINYEQRMILQRHYLFTTDMDQLQKGAADYFCSFDYIKTYYDLFGEYVLAAQISPFEASAQDKSFEKLMTVYDVFCSSDMKKYRLTDGLFWLRPLQAGAALTEERFGRLTDDTGSNISRRNQAFCEMTAMYWIWKNSPHSLYKGMYHYRRHLMITSYQINELEKQGYDVVLPVPRMMFPSIIEAYYKLTVISEDDYQMLLDTLEEVAPEYRDWAQKVLNNNMYFAFNILIAKEDVFNAYCEFVFGILIKIDQKFQQEGNIRDDRYAGFLAEMLTTVFFSYHRNDLKIALADIEQYQPNKWRLV